MENLSSLLNSYNLIINECSNIIISYIEQLRKLGVVIQDKLYTEHEFELLDNQTIMYYKDDDMTPDELECCEDLESTGVTREQLNNLLEKIHKINMECF